MDKIAVLIPCYNESSTIGKVVTDFRRVLPEAARKMAVISACFFLPVFSLYVRTGLVPDFPTLIVCGFTMLAAIQSFFAGLMLQTMLQKNRQDFEMELQRVSERKESL